jgi:hypothetical protein
VAQYLRVKPNIVEGADHFATMDLRLINRHLR